MAACVSVVAVVLFVAIFVVCRSWRRERVKKKQAIANAHAVTQWTKKVIIGKHNFYSAVRSVLFDRCAFIITLVHCCSKVRLILLLKLGSKCKNNNTVRHIYTKNGPKIHLSTLWAFRTSSVSDIGQQWGWGWCGGAHHPD